MQTALRQSLRLVVIALLAASLAACAAAPGTASPPPATIGATPSQASTGPLVVVETQGGECMQGACGGTIAIEIDGRVHATGPTPKELGTVPSEIREALETEIAQADFVRLKSRPFTDTCPIAFDGQQTIYTFATGAGTERIDSCEVVVDPAHPLFLAVAAALGSVAR